MSYATLDNFKQRLGDDWYAQLTDRLNRTTADDDVGQAILDGAHGTINTYLGKRYRTPIDTTGEPEREEFLRDATLNIAEYKAWSSTPFNTDILERVKGAYLETRRLLERIADGKADVPGTSTIPSATSAGPSAIVTGDKRIFTEDAMKGL